MFGNFQSDVALCAVREYTGPACTLCVEQITGIATVAAEQALLRLVTQWNKGTVSYRSETEISENALKAVKGAYRQYQFRTISLARLNRLLDVLTKQFTFKTTNELDMTSLAIDIGYSGGLEVTIDLETPILLACKLTLKTMLDALTYPSMKRAHYIINLISDDEDNIPSDTETEIMDEDIVYESPVEIDEKDIMRIDPKKGWPYTEVDSKELKCYSMFRKAIRSDSD